MAINPGIPQGAPFPASLTVLAVTGLASTISYDNLYYPGGSPITCAGYPGAGGFLDIYGVLFTLANGDVVDFWSNGTFAEGPPLSYSVAVVNSGMSVVDYRSGGVAASAVPEPASLGLLAVGLLGALTWRIRLAGLRSLVAPGDEPQSRWMSDDAVRGPTCLWLSRPNDSESSGPGRHGVTRAVARRTMPQTRIRLFRSPPSGRDRRQAWWRRTQN